MAESKIVTVEGSYMGVAIATGDHFNVVCVTSAKDHVFAFDRANATLLHEALGRALAKEG